MASVGDKVRVLPNKAGQPPREGVVTGVSGNLLSIRWSTGEETSFIPAYGSITVLGRTRAASASAGTKSRATKQAKTAASGKSGSAKRATKPAKATKR